MSKDARPSLRTVLRLANAGARLARDGRMSLANAGACHAGAGRRTRLFPADIPDSFTREYGCTLAEWRRDLPRAVTAGGAVLQPVDDHQALVTLASSQGRLHLQWNALPPRQIALMRMPRLQVGFRFERAEPSARLAFMRLFDLSLQRGGG